MPRFTAEQIYAFAREAGFSPDQAATMTAVALAESGGDSRSHATHGEDSQGLWQINAQAHPDLAHQYELYNPAQNAKAAFAVSHHGTDVSPWTVTHGGLSARYLRFKDEAQAAAAAYGDGPNRGVWTGTIGYGHPLSPGDPQGGRPAPSTSDAHHVDGSANVVVSQNTGTAGTAQQVIAAQLGVPLEDEGGARFGVPLDPAADGGAPGTTAVTDAHTDHLHVFLGSALAQDGDRYIFGVMDNLDDPNPGAFDCSMLVQWSASQAGVHLERNAWHQYQQLHDQGMVIPVKDGINTPGALLFSFSTDPNGSRAPVQQHVAISLGDGKTIEARGSQYGVGSFDANTRRFQYAALIPGISDHVGPIGALPDTHAVVMPPPDPGHAPAPPAADPHAADPHPADPHPGPAPAPHDEFAVRLARDPDLLDTGHPDTTPPPVVPPPVDPVPVPDPHHDPPASNVASAVDADGDGYDDSLQHANEPWSLPPPDPYQHDDGWDHEHGGGHH